MLPSDRRRCDRAAWPGLAAEYARLPPFHGARATAPNRLEVIFSAHPRVALGLAGATYDVTADPGGLYVVGGEATTLLRVPEWSDTLEIYPDMAFLRACAAEVGLPGFELTPSLGDRRRVAFRRDLPMVAIAHVLRRACLGTAALTDIEGSTWLLHLARCVLERQHGRALSDVRRRAHRLSRRQLARLAEHVDANLTRTVTLPELAAVAGLSLFHFARCFKASTGMPPHRYVAARRMEAAKRALLGRNTSVETVAWELGYANLSHFRRQFRQEFGASPGGLQDWAS